MEQSNFEKNQTVLFGTEWFFYLLTFNFGANFMTRYTFNQVRCFFLHLFSIDFMV